MARSVKAEAGFIEVEGLRELQAALRDVDRSFPRIIAQASKRAAEHTVKAATAKAEGVSRMAAKAAESLVAKGEQRGASVRFGSNRYPFALGAEFGSVAFRQFPAWRGSSHGAGYFVFPAIRESAKETTDLFERALDEVLRRNFPE